MRDEAIFTVTVAWVLLGLVMLTGCDQRGLSLLRPYQRIASRSHDNRIVHLYPGCTGFIGAKNLVLTAGHCADGKPKLRVRFTDGSERDFTTKFVLFDIPLGLDFAILNGDTGTRPAFTLSDKAPTIGEHCQHVGYELGDYHKQRVYYAVFLGANHHDGWGISYDFATDAIWGNSGSPFLNSQGEVIGILSSLNLQGSTIYPVTYAVPIMFVRRMVQSAEGK